jgi:hypothetical protein
MAIEAMVIREVEVVSESPLYILMTGSAARPRRALKHDDLPLCSTWRHPSGSSNGRCSLRANDPMESVVLRSPRGGWLNAGTGFRELEIQFVGSCSNHTGDGLGRCGCCNRRRRGVAR